MAAEELTAKRPKLTRSYTQLFSDQKDESTCTYHVFSKLLLKNRVELFYPLPIEDDLYTTNNCNRFLNTKKFDLTKLTPEECTRNGYLKIILFYYFYSVYDEYRNRNPTQEKGTFYITDIDAAHPYINRMLIPKRFKEHEKEITEILHIVNYATN